MMRPICRSCKENPAAVNYVSEQKTRYRSQCASCIRKKNKQKPVPPSWMRAGYKKKSKCDRCGFTAAHVKTQIRVFYVDGNLKNNNLTNLKSICLNCVAAITESKTSWKPADLIADY
jgi:hypothetical protein